MNSITETWSRKTFDVEAVQVTEANAAKVVAWCGGSAARSLDSRKSVYVLVDVVRFERHKQDKAWVGDWVVYNGDTFMVYKDKSFRITFGKKQSDERAVLKEKISQLVRGVMVEQDCATYHGESRKTSGLDARTAEKILGLLGM